MGHSQPARVPSIHRTEQNMALNKDFMDRLRTGRVSVPMTDPDQLGSLYFPKACLWLLQAFGHVLPNPLQFFLLSQAMKVPSCAQAARRSVFLQWMEGVRKDLESFDTK